MRDILFRGKRLDNGEWVEGDLLQNVDCLKIREQEVKINYIAKSFVIIPETVGQYTGLTAKGKKIFEGDIVQVSIYYDVGCYPHTDIKTIEVKIPDIYKINIEKCIEVIGNIYDNPELMEG